MLLCSGLQALLTKKAKPLSTTTSILLAQKTILMSFTVENWSESYVHMPSVFNPEDFYKTETPILIFDKDSSGNEESITLGYNLNSVWQSDSLIQDQYRSALDYRGVHSFLLGIGFASGQAHQILYPNPASSRELDPQVLAIWQTLRHLQG